MAEINLLQNRVHDTTFSSQRQSRGALVVLTIVLIVLGVAGGGLLFLARSLTDKSIQLQTQNTALQNQLNQEQPQLANAKTLQAQFANIRTLVDNHVYLTPLLEEVGKVTYAKAQFITLGFTSSGDVHIEGRVSDYSSLAKLILGLNSSTNFRNVRLLSVSPSAGEVNGFLFAIDMNAAPELFTKPKTP
jgi:hypothetical protein